VKKALDRKKKEYGAKEEKRHFEHQDSHPDGVLLEKDQESAQRSSRAATSTKPGPDLIRGRGRLLPVV